MVENLRQFIDQLIHLEDNEYQEIAAAASKMFLKKRDHLVKVGDISNKIVFFFDGYFRFYHYLEDGTEVTSDFVFSPYVATSYTSLITGEPSNVYVQAMENMNVLSIKKSDLQTLYLKYHNIEKLGRLFAEQNIISLEKHLFCLLNYSAEKRYKYLIINYPQFIQKIPLQYIASYLGITKETLSRIRKKSTLSS